MGSKIFIEKEIIPTESALKEALGEKYKLWQLVRNYTIEKYPNAIQEWNFPGKKYGWSFRIKDKKRAIVYLLPYEGYFKVALVFGPKAMACVLQSSVSQDIKTELENAIPYAEGRGIRIEVKNTIVINDIKELIEIKIAN
jgi:hypothetical protein